MESAMGAPSQSHGCRSQRAFGESSAEGEWEGRRKSRQWGQWCGEVKVWAMSKVTHGRKLWVTV